MKEKISSNVWLWLAAFFLACMPVSSQTDLTNISKELQKAFVTNDSIFSQPYVDVDQWRESPLRHRYVHGGFRGTNTRFSFYFPPSEQYEGRFFQYITPFPDSENLSQGAEGEQDKVGFSISSGAYFVETNGGGAIDFANPRANDPTIGAYRANAASADFSRVVAQKLYGGSRPFGYAFGGSGGAYRTVGGIENTEGVWDGVVPYVLGSPVAIPNVFTVRMHAMRILKDKFPQIIDAMDAGGSGDMYAGLNAEEQEALEEVTSMGFPTQSWFDYKNMGIHGFLVLYPGVVMADRTYFTRDFWNTPGYLGSSPTQSLLDARLQHKSRIRAAVVTDRAIELDLIEPVSEEERGSADTAWKSMGGSDAGKPVAYQLEDRVPDVDFLGGDLNILSGEGAGQSLQIEKIRGDKVVLAPTNPPQLLMKLKPGDEVEVDNSNFLAVQTYHRHQDPGPEYQVWKQFRDGTGNPIYPQRPMLIGPLFTRSASGSLPTGKFKGKMILLGSLLDREAFPWQCDWYSTRVKEHLGDAADDHFRLWYTERAVHGDQQDHLGDPTQAISYIGVLQQALRDLAAWVEEERKPAPSTSYEVQDGQVTLPAGADERQGIQPAVNLMANGGKRAEVVVGEEVDFEVHIQVPEGQGNIVSVDWDFDGDQLYPLSSSLGDTSKNSLSLKESKSFETPGTYFITVRVASERKGKKTTPFARIQNLSRARVVVQ